MELGPFSSCKCLKTKDKVRAAAVSSVAAARRILEEHSPGVILLEEEAVAGDSFETSEAGAADFVERKTNAFAEARGLIQQRLRQATEEMERAEKADDASGEEDFGEVLRHELNNPLTGILGNAELLLAEIRRKKDGQIPSGWKLSPHWPCGCEKLCAA